MRILIGILLMSSLIFAENKARIVLAAASPARQIAVSLNATFYVDLPSNPSTGFGWHVVEIDTGKIMAIDSGTVRVDSAMADKKLVGAAGSCRFGFKAVGPGSSRIKMKYFRLWEPADVADSFSVMIKIKK